MSTAFNQIVDRTIQSIVANVGIKIVMFAKTGVVAALGRRISSLKPEFDRLVIKSTDSVRWYHASGVMCIVSLESFPSVNEAKGVSADVIFAEETYKDDEAFQKEIAAPTREVGCQVVYVPNLYEDTIQQSVVTYVPVGFGPGDRFITVETENGGQRLGVIPGRRVDPIVFVHDYYPFPESCRTLPMPGSSVASIATLFDSLTIEEDDAAKK